MVPGEFQQGSFTIRRGQVSVSCRPLLFMVSRKSKGAWQEMRVTAPDGSSLRAVGVIPCALLWSRVFLSRPCRGVCRAVCRHFAVVRVRHAGKPAVSDPSAQGKVYRLKTQDALDRKGEATRKGCSMHVRLESRDLPEFEHQERSS